MRIHRRSGGSQSEILNPHWRKEFGDD